MVEYLYHVDKEDNILGKVERNEAHLKGVFHRTGVVLVFNSKGEIFLAQRSPVKKICPDHVDSACSFHVTYGLSYLEAAKKELFEETKIKGEPEYLGKFLIEQNNDNMVVATFKIVYDGKLVLDPKEAISGRFYSLEEADEIIKNKKVTPWLKGAWKIYKEKK